MKVFYKKTIALIYLAIFLFSLFIPFTKAFAQTKTGELIITAKQSTIDTKNALTITAQSLKTGFNQTVSFTSSPESATFSNNNQCKITAPNNDSCSIYFTPLLPGSYQIKASSVITNDKFTYSSNILNITATPEITPTQAPTTLLTSSDCKLPQELNADKTSCITPTETKYTLLAPLPGLKSIDTQKNDTDNPCPFGNYLNIMIRLIIGICAVLAMIMIVMGGVEYMTSELISSKEAGKERILHAILGLVIALGAYTILNTINPQLLNVCLGELPTATITVGGPDSGDNIIDPDFAKGLRIYKTGTISSGTVSAIAKLSDGTGWKISKFTIHAKKNGMTIELMKGSISNYDSYIPIKPGYGGYAPVGSAVVDDHKTPYGTWKILSTIYTPGKAQFNKKGSNMGAAFWLLNPMKSGERGIGIHGNKDGTLTTTNGCIRLINADILALEPYITPGIPVVIVD